MDIIAKTKMETNTNTYTHINKNTNTIKHGMLSLEVSSIAGYSALELCVVYIEFGLAKVIFAQGL